MPEIKEIIWDGDNTIWNWVRYAAKAYPAMAKTISEETGIPEDDVIAGMKNYYTQVGTMESPWLIQGLHQLGFFKRARKPFDIEHLRQLTKKKFQHYRHKYFKPYDGVCETIILANKRGIINRLLTDAPKVQAIMRVKKALLEDEFTSIHAVKTNEIVRILPPDILLEQEAGKYDINCEVEELEIEKPDTRLEHILRIVRETQSEVRRYIENHVAIVGDNDKKDMELVRRYGCFGIHAVWGKPDEEDLRILSLFAPEKILQKSMSVLKPETKPLKPGKVIAIEFGNEIQKKLQKHLGIAA